MQAERRQRKQRQEAGPQQRQEAAGADAASSPSLSPAAGGESVQALERLNEARLTPLLLSFFQSDAALLREAGAEAEQAAALLSRRELQRRRRLHFLRCQLLLSNKLRRRWEALNALTAELRAVCLLEDRTSLPAGLPSTRDCCGRPLLPDSPGMTGADPLTETETRRHLDWQQRQSERGQRH